MAKLEIIDSGQLGDGWKTDFSTFGDRPRLIESTGIFSSKTHELSEELVYIERLTEETKYSILRKVGWSIVGGVLTGGVGALAGLVLAGNDKEVSFVAELSNGKKWVGTADPDTFKKMASYAAKNSSNRLPSPDAQTIIIEQPSERERIGDAACPKCGAQIAPQFKFCPACGAENA